MHIKSIEDTPNYNTIKINLSEKRKDNQSNTYT
ncbi:MAG: scaffolding protein, partial [Staphylococcus sp.]|nr:scaffolding protein [Staphylococcus sp.]